MESCRDKHVQSYISQPITIPNNNYNNFQQELKQNFFNPSKNSPPDVFINKLTSRLHEYYDRSHIRLYNDYAHDTN